MGVSCCKAQSEAGRDSIFDQKQIEEQSYQISQWPSNDPFIEKWKEQNKNSELIFWKPMKSRQGNKYYIGDWNGGKPKGQGMIYSLGQYILVGKFENGLPNGFCEIQNLSPPFQYKGQMKNGKAEGHGIYKNEIIGIQFEGLWENSFLKSGTIVFFKDQNISTIIFDDYQTGKGSIYYKDSKKYTGIIDKNTLIPHGRGIVTFPFGSDKFQYQGEFRFGMFHGKGSLQWIDGARYEGQYLCGKKNGYGKYVYASHKIYQGFWLDGKQDGPGKLYEESSAKEEIGFWKNGSFIEKLSLYSYTKQKNAQAEKFLGYRQKINKQLQAKAIKLKQNSNINKIKDHEQKSFTIQPQLHSRRQTTDSIKQSKQQ